MRLLIMSKKFIIILLIIIILVTMFFSVSLIYNRAELTFSSDIYYQGNVDEKVIAFACNIDWGNEHIPEMLKIFNEHNIQITYFPTGKWAKNNKATLLEIYESNHEIGNHGYSHLDYDKLNYERNKEEIQKAHDIIEEITNSSPIYFAPPSGAYNDNTIRAAKDLGYHLIMWSIDTIDWRHDSTKDIIIERVISKAHNSAIVLMHPTEETVKALPEIINHLYKNDYKIGKISDVIKK